MPGDVRYPPTATGRPTGPPSAVPGRRRLPTRAAAPAAAVLAALLLLTGCAGPAGDDGLTVRVAQFPWSAAQLTNAILAEVVARHPELGVGRMRTIQVSPATAWAGAQRGDVDVLTEIAMPNQSDLAAEADQRMDLLRPTYDGAEQGWYVPTYATRPGQPLAGLTSVTQLNDYAAALGGRLVDSDPSFLTTEYNAARLRGYGIDLEQVASSESAQLAELRRSYVQQQPILVYLYHPHWVFEEFEMTKLTEPNPAREDCFTTGDGACAMPAYSGWTAVSHELRGTAPRFVDALARFRLSIPDVEQMLQRVDVQDEEVEVVARDYVANHPDLVKQWVGEP